MENASYHLADTVIEPLRPVVVNHCDQTILGLLKIYGLSFGCEHLYLGAVYLVDL